MSVSIEPGLVFAVPLTEGSFAFGQLVAPQHPIFYMVAYDFMAEHPAITCKDIETARPVLMGNFFDILIRNGRWPAIGKVVTPRVPFPCFKVKIGDKLYVETWDRQRRREASAEDCEELQFRTDHSAIILEDALKAHFGMRPWEPKWFDSLKSEAVWRASRVFGG